MKLSAILLAAGNSSRMGPQNKLLLPFRGKALFLHALDALLASDVSEIILVTGFEASNIKRLLKPHEKLKVVPHSDYKEGMTSSIQAGIQACSAHCSGFLICLSDMPFLTSGDYNRIVGTFKNSKASQPILLPFCANKKRNPVLFDAHYKTALLAHIPSNGCKAIVEKNKNNLIQIPFDNPSIFTDIDTIKEYQNYQREA